jgi:hypothetical protein
MTGQPKRPTEAISGEFKAQNIANTLWVYATMGTEPGGGDDGAAGAAGGGDIRGVQNAEYCKL